MFVPVSNTVTGATLLFGASPYDQANCLGLSTCQNIGHRTNMTDAAGSESWSYDVVDRIHKDQRTTNSITKSATYNLDYAGNVTSLVYPTGRTVNYTYDAANRPSTAIDGSNGITYATGFTTSPGGTCLNNVTCYTPQGTFYALSIGQSTSLTNGLNLTHIYNNRLQPQEFKASSSGGNAIDITYSFVDPTTSKNASHVFSITNNLDTTRSQTFAYDQVNRITSALTTSTYATSPARCWGETYQYDGVTNGAWGNLTQIAATTNSAYIGCTQESGFTKTVDGNNHLSGFSYDLSGNTQNDGVNSYAWNAESQLNTAAGVTYTYDGDGRRVSKVSSKVYWYGSGGDILAETDASGNTTAEYIFFGGKRIALLPAGSTPIYYVEDLLGTSRVTTTNTGVVCYDADFYPYGGERSYANTCPQNNYKFEGKERDTESGNDDFGARYYSNRFGRWLSADWSAVPVPAPYANLANPQTLNLYSMVADDPESFADLDGHCIYDGCIVEIAIGAAALSYAAYKVVQAYYHEKQMEATKQSANAQFDLLMADPMRPGAANIDIDKTVRGIVNDETKTLALAQQSASDANAAVSTVGSVAMSAVTGGTSTSTGPSPINAEKAIGAGLKVATKGVKEVIKATQPGPGGQGQQQQSPSLWGGLKSLFSSTPKPPSPPQPKPPCPNTGTQVCS